MLNSVIWRNHCANILKKAVCMGKQSGGFYAVRSGRSPGIYLTWAECERQVKGFSKARYKKFSTEKEALSFIQDSSVADEKISLEVPSQNEEIKSLSQALKDTNFIVDQEVQPSSSASHKKTTGKSPAGQKKRKLLTVGTNEVMQPKKQKLDVASKKKGGDSPKSVLVYTDGACCFNGTDDAKAAIGVYWGPNHPLNISERLPGRQTNNRAEIHAAVKALQQAKGIGAENVTLYTDSSFLVTAITKWIHGWKKNGWKLATGETVKNKDDFEELEKAKKGLTVNWVHVRGHQGILGNEEADRLAVQALNKPL